MFQERDGPPRYVSCGISCVGQGVRVTERLGDGQTTGGRGRGETLGEGHGESVGEDSVTTAP